MSISKLVPIDVLISEGKCIKIDTDKLNPFGGYSFDLFTGKRLAEMIESVKRFGVCRPITVRHCNDGNYEILDGHYRVAACKSIKIESVPATIEQLNDEEALLYISDASPIGLLLKDGIDIRDYDYKKTENYQKIESARVFPDDGFSMALDEYIERILLTPHEVIDNYERIYDMGNPYELNYKECGFISLAKEIIKIMKPMDEEDIKEIEKWKKSKVPKDITALREFEIAAFEEAIELANTFVRPGGYIEQLKKYLDLDLDRFDYRNMRNRRERVKILYFLHMLRKRDFVGINVLELLSKPSMENIDNSFLGWETSNGRFIKLIKHELEMELTLDRRTEEEKEDPFGPADGCHAKDNIKGAVVHVVESWGSYLYNAQMNMIYMDESGYNHVFDGDIATLKSALSERPKLTRDIELKILPLLL